MMFGFKRKVYPKLQIVVRMKNGKVYTSKLYVWDDVYVFRRANNICKEGIRISNNRTSEGTWDDRKATDEEMRLDSWVTMRFCDTTIDKEKTLVIYYPPSEIEKVEVNKISVG